MKILLSAIVICLFAAIAMEASESLEECLFVSQPGKRKINRSLPIPRNPCAGIYKTEGITYQLYFEGLYLQPNGSNLYYGAEAVGLNSGVAAPILSPYWQILEIDPDYHPGFEIGVSLRLNQANISIDVNYERLHAQDKESFQAPPPEGTMVGQIFDIGPNSQKYKVAKGKAISHFDEANLRIGKQLCCFENFYLNFYGGVGVSRIRHTLTSKYFDISAPLARTVKTSSLFTGAGPEVGLDYHFRIYEDFFMSGNSTIPLFVGRMENYTTFRSWSPVLAAVGNPVPNYQTTTVPNRTQLIPGFEQKLGFTYLIYKHSSRVTIEAGYRVQIYLNAVQTMDMISQALPADAIEVPNVGVFALAFNRTLSNFILTGPYAIIGSEF